MTTRSVTSEGQRDHPYGAEMEAERRGWYEIVGLVRSLTPEECVEPGYQRDPDWTVRDVVAHVGTWLAEAETQFERIGAGTYEGHEVDVDAMNAAFLAAMQGQPWEVAWVQANAARTRLLDEWYHCASPPRRPEGGSASRRASTTPSTSDDCASGSWS